MGVAVEVAAGEIEAPGTFEVDLDDGIEDEEGGIAFIALYVQVVQVFNLAEVSVLVAFPREETEVFGVQDETGGRELQVSLGLETETATHVIVAFDDVEIVAFGAT